MAKTPTVNVLLDRFQGEVHSVFYPFLVISVIESSGPLTKDEIRDEIFRRTNGFMQKESGAHNLLVGRIEKTFRLIERVNKSSTATTARYQLTAKGKKLYADSLEQVIHPLVDSLS